MKVISIDGFTEHLHCTQWFFIMEKGSVDVLNLRKKSKILWGAKNGYYMTLLRTPPLKTFIFGVYGFVITSFDIYTTEMVILISRLSSRLI